MLKTRPETTRRLLVSIFAATLLTTGTPVIAAMKAKTIVKTGAAVVAVYVGAEKLRGYLGKFKHDIAEYNRFYTGIQARAARAIIFDPETGNMCGPSAFAAFRITYLATEADPETMYSYVREMHLENSPRTGRGGISRPSVANGDGSLLLGQPGESSIFDNVDLMANELDRRHRDGKPVGYIVYLNSHPLWRYVAEKLVTAREQKKILMEIAEGRVIMDIFDQKDHFVLVNGVIRDIKTGKITEVLLVDGGLPDLAKINDGSFGLSRAKGEPKTSEKIDRNDYVLYRGASYSVPLEVFEQAVSWNIRFAFSTSSHFKYGNGSAHPSVGTNENRSNVLNKECQPYYDKKHPELTKSCM